MSLESPIAIPTSAKVTNELNAPEPESAKSEAEYPSNFNELLAVPQ
jgi:hypothetical protein